LFVVEQGVDWYIQAILIIEHSSR